MAYRKAPRRRAASSRGGYGSARRSTRSRKRPATAARRRASASRRRSGGVIRLEIVQAPANPMVRGHTINSEPKAPRRAQF